MTTTETKTEFKNLRQLVIKNITNHESRHIENIEKIQLKDELMQNYAFSRYLTKLRQNQLENDLISFEQAKKNILKKINSDIQKSIEKYTNKIEMVENAPDFKDCTISIEWKKSYTWGSNPKAELKVNTSKLYQYYTGSSIGGCGYDKESTAIAEVLNMCPSFLKLLYSHYENNTNKTCEEVFSYGVNNSYAGLPYLSGGVGASCYYRNVEAVGFKLNHVSSGKMFDVYTIEKAV